MTSSRLALAFVVLLALAGCNGLGPTNPFTAGTIGESTATGAGPSPTTASGPSTATAPDRTVTTARPARRATGIPGATVARNYPPGLTPDGVVAPFALADQHGWVLDTTNYTVFERRELWAANGTLLTARAERVRVADSRYRYDRDVWGERTVDGTPGRQSTYANGSRVVRRSGGSTHVVVGPDGSPLAPAAVPHGSPRNAERIAVLGLRLRDSAAVRFSNGTYHVRATNASLAALELGGVTLTDVSVVEFRAVVDSTGLVRQYRLAVRGRLDGRRVEGFERVRYADVGSTTVSLPVWADGLSSEAGTRDRTRVTNESAG